MFVFRYESQRWKSGSNDPKILERLTTREAILQEHNFHRGLLIDFDYSKFTDEDQVVSDGERTVCGLEYHITFCSDLLLRAQSLSWLSTS